MQILVDIPEEVYDRCKKYRLHCGEAEVLEGAVARGIPLPKGHGRLIDVDCLVDDFKASKKISFADRMDISCIVDHAPTIIETDKESEE